MDAQYDKIGSKYDEFKSETTLPLPERYTFMRILGDLTGKSVLDLACGTGFYTQLMKTKGAARAVGVDISQEMIALARQKEQEAPLGLEYHVHDATELPQLGHFDLVTSVYLFNYVPTSQAMASVFRRVYDNLVPGGRFCSITVDPGYTPQKPNWTKYGLTILSQRFEGDRYVGRARFHTEPPVDFDYYTYELATYEWALKQAGFREFQWHTMEIPPAALERYGAEYWHTYLDNPLVIALSCQK